MGEATGSDGPWHWLSGARMAVKTWPVPCFRGHTGSSLPAPGAMLPTPSPHALEPINTLQDFQRRGYPENKEFMLVCYCIFFCFLVFSLCILY